MGSENCRNRIESERRLKKMLSVAFYLYFRMVIRIWKRNIGGRMYFCLYTDRICGTYMHIERELRPPAPVKEGVPG